MKFNVDKNTTEMKMVKIIRGNELSSAPLTFKNTQIGQIHQKRKMKWRRKDDQSSEHSSNLSYVFVTMKIIRGYELSSVFYEDVRRLPAMSTYHLNSWC